MKKKIQDLVISDRFLFRGATVEAVEEPRQHSEKGVILESTVKCLIVDESQFVLVSAYPFEQVEIV